jgi:hypothetical protein
MAAGAQPYLCACCRARLAIRIVQAPEAAAHCNGIVVVVLLLLIQRPAEGCAGREALISATIACDK